MGYPKSNLPGDYGYVYVISDTERGRVKVGKTKHLRRRVREVLLAAGVKPELAMVFTTPLVTNFSELEKKTLDKYAGDRVHGEWLDGDFEEIRSYVMDEAVKMLSKHSEAYFDAKEAKDVSVGKDHEMPVMNMLPFPMPKRVVIEW